MLVLTRKIGEEIVIDGDIRVTILAVRGNQVRLGFQAPPHVSIFRQELLGAAAGHAAPAELCASASGH